MPFLNKLLFFLWRQKQKDFGLRKKTRAVLARNRTRDSSIEYTVRLLSNFPGLWQRTIEQTPGGRCQWGNVLFVAEGEADLYLVLNSTRLPNSAGSDFALPSVSRDRIWGLHMEPEPYVRKLGYDDPREHDRISRFYTNCGHLLKLGGIYHPAPPYVHFLTGKSWDFLIKTPPPRKTFDLGIICSAMKTLEGHRKRLTFLDQLEESRLEFAIWGRGEELKRYRGYQGFAFSKWSALSRCRYSIALENSIAPLYWTEKLTDSLLSFSYPIYYGAQATGNFFPQESFTPIDIESTACIDTIRGLLSSDTYERYFSALCEARNAVLYTHNLHAFIVKEIERHFRPTPITRS